MALAGACAYTRYKAFFYKDSLFMGPLQGPY